MEYVYLINTFNYTYEYGDKMWKFDNISGYRKLPDDYLKAKVIWYTVK